MPCRFDVATTCPDRLIPRALQPSISAWRHLACDPSVVERSDLTIDMPRTHAHVARWSEGYPRLVEREAQRLSDIDIVIADIPPLACDAAALAGVPVFAIANFSWDWIYEQLGLGAAAADAARGYRHAERLFRLTPAAPMPSFLRVDDVGVLARRAQRPRYVAREALGIQLHQRAVLIAVRSPGLCSLPPTTTDIVYLVPSEWPHQREDVRTIPRDLPFCDALFAADAVVGKVGYGLCADAAAAGTPFLYAQRDGFPEDAILSAWLEETAAATRVELTTLRSGTWLEALEELLCRQRPEPLETPAADRIAEKISESL